MAVVTKTNPLDVVIPTGATAVSTGVDLGDRKVVGIIMSAAWVAAGLSFKVSADGVTYVPLMSDSTTEVTMSVAAASGYNAHAALASFRWIKLVSGTNAVNVDQTANRTIRLITRPAL